VRDVLALIVCGNRINEVIAAALGPLPLDQLPKSKPVTPYAVFPDDTHWPAVGKTALASAPHQHGSQRTPGARHSRRQQKAQCGGHKSRRPTGRIAMACLTAEMRNPCERWRWPKTRPQGFDRQGRGRSQWPGPPPR